MEKNCCKTCCIESGSAFFISPTKLLTTFHGIKQCFNGEEILCTKTDNSSFNAKCINYDEDLDIAILETVNFQNEHFLEISNSAIITGASWDGFGFPSTDEGQKVGMPLTGTILRHIEFSLATKYDISLNVNDISENPIYEGFSGAPVVDSYDMVIGILTYQNDKRLAALSIKKAYQFLANCNVTIHTDQLESFNKYSNEIFHSFEDPIKNVCYAEMSKILPLKQPKILLAELKGKIFYPEQTKNLEELINDLRLNKNLNSKLWNGWLKFLTYISIIKGSIAEANKITITLTGEELKRVWGIKVNSSKIKISLRLNFFFTEENQFFSISRAYITDKHGHNNLTENTCSIFNSQTEDFGIRNFTAAHKRNVISDISQPPNSSFTVFEKLDFGILSLTQLTKEVGNSTTLANAIDNLENIFRNAIK